MYVRFVLAEVASVDNSVCFEEENVIDKVGRISDGDPFVLVVVVLPSAATPCGLLRLAVGGQSS